jgi:hypothetical protein
MAPFPLIFLYWQTLDPRIYWFYSLLHCHKQRCVFFPFPRVFLVGATSLVLQQQLSQFLTTFFIRSLAVFFILGALSVKPVSSRSAKQPG